MNTEKREGESDGSVTFTLVKLDVKAAPRAVLILVRADKPGITNFFNSLIFL